VQIPTQALKLAKDPGNTFDLAGPYTYPMENCRRTESSFPLWVEIKGKSKVLSGSLTDLCAYVGKEFCRASANFHGIFIGSPSLNPNIKVDI
jgi:hypothetical protein